LDWIVAHDEYGTSWELGDYTVSVTKPVPKIVAMEPNRVPT
jgi:hypothetical protein